MDSLDDAVRKGWEDVIIENETKKQQTKPPKTTL